MQLTDNQYQGTRPFSDYLRLFVAPVFPRCSACPCLQLVVFGVLGYWAGEAYRAGARSAAASGATRARPGASACAASVTWLWVLFLIALFLLATASMAWMRSASGILISRFVWVGWMYFTGMNLDRAWGRPLLALVTLLGVVQTVIAERLIDKLNARTTPARDRRADRRRHLVGHRTLRRAHGAWQRDALERVAPPARADRRGSRSG